MKKISLEIISICIFKFYWRSSVNFSRKIIKINLKLEFYIRTIETGVLTNESFEGSFWQENSLRDGSPWAQNCQYSSAPDNLRVRLILHAFVLLSWGGPLGAGVIDWYHIVTTQCWQCNNPAGCSIDPVLLHDRNIHAVQGNDFFVLGV